MKRVLILALVLILIVPSVMAQEEYSGVDRFTDSVDLFFTGEENKVNVALEIREKEVNSAIVNTQNGNEEDAIKNLERAQVKLELVQEKVSLENADDVKTSVEDVKETIVNEGLEEEFANYIYQEEKTQLTAELTLKTYEYCKSLAEEDFNAMLNEELCNPETASKGLEKELQELRQIQEDAFYELMLEIRSCIDDPGTCNCEQSQDSTQKAKCEKMVALALKCEYTEDEGACSELKAMEPVAGDNFAESFVPGFLMDMFRQRESMVDYDIEHSAGVPPECWNENDKPECEQYDYLKEGKGREDKDESVPTIYESIPQCFNENNVFLEEECGEITIVWKNGLINYIIGKELENIIDNFENASENTIDIDGMEGRTMSEDIVVEIDGIKNQIAERTFAPGTEGFGEAGKDIKTVVIEEGDSNGDDGLKTEVVTGGSNGDDGLKTEVVTGSGGGNNFVETGDGDGSNNFVESDGGSNTIDSGNTIDEGSNTIDEGSMDVSDNIVDSGSSGSNDVGGVDEGPGEPGVVDEA
ncbi:MAG: hypothetical protein ABIJ18_05910 [archaeon]